LPETGVMYNIDKFIYLGTPVSENHNVIYTRAALGLNSLEKLRAASGVKLGAQEVGELPGLHTCNQLRGRRDTR
jgi:hypothetical protein